MSMSFICIFSLLSHVFCYVSLTFCVCVYKCKLDARDYITSIVHCLCHGHMRTNAIYTAHALYNVQCAYNIHTLHNILYAFLFIKCLNLVDDGDRGFLLPYTVRMASNLLGSYAAKQLQNVSKLRAHKTISCDHYSNAFFPMYVSFFSVSVSFFLSIVM